MEKEKKCIKPEEAADVEKKEEELSEDDLDQVAGGRVVDQFYKENNDYHKK